MPDVLEFLTPVGMLQWLLRSNSLDQITKRLIVITSTLYITGVFVKNVDLLAFGVHNVLPARVPTILVGCLVFAISVICTLVCGALCWSLRRTRLVSVEAPRAWLLLVVNTLFIFSVSLAVLHEAYLHLSWVFDPASFNDPSSILEFLLFGFVIALPIFLERVARPKTQSNQWLLIFCLTICFGAYVWLYRDIFYETLPQWLGGGHPITVRFVIKPDAMAQYRTAGLTIFDSGVTPSVQIIDSDDSSFTLFGKRIVQLAAAKSTVYPYSFTISRDQIQSIIYKPVDWSWMMFADDRCWANQSEGSEPRTMGAVIPQGLSPSDSKLVLAKWQLTPPAHFDGCYPNLFLKDLVEAAPEFSRFITTWNSAPNKQTGAVDVYLNFSPR